MPTTSEDWVREAFALTRHLAAPRPLRYWLEFLVSLSIGWAAFYLCGVAGRPWSAAWFVVSILTFYRAIVFIHEVVHLRAREMRSFQVGWNVLAGVPLLTPSFVYEFHLQHHARDKYGTPDDGEYVPWGVGPPGHILLLPLASLISPLLAVLRFLLLTPLGWLLPPIRPWLYERASAMKVRYGHRRYDLQKQGLPWWRVQESGACLWAWSVAAALANGWLSIRWVLLALGVMSAVAVLNSIRILASHRYRSDDRAMTFVEQIKDSVNHPEGVLAEIWAPAGLRYHALHHVLPSLPYHVLPEAHRILMKRLPTDSFYRHTNSPSLWQTLKTLWADARREKLIVSRKGAKYR